MTYNKNTPLQHVSCAFPPRFLQVEKHEHASSTKQPDIENFPDIRKSTSYHKSQTSDDDYDMPPEPPGECTQEVEEHFAAMFERKEKVTQPNHPNQISEMTEKQITKQSSTFCNKTMQV